MRIEGYWALLSVVAIVVVVSIGLGWLLWESSRRPLFHEEYVSERFPNILTTWKQTYPVSDKGGTMAFFDIGWNMVVVIVPDRKELAWHISELRATPSDATLLAGTAHEVHVEAAEDSLIICKLGKKHRFTIERGAAEKLQRQIIELTNETDWTVLNVVAENCCGETRRSVLGMIGE